MSMVIPCCNYIPTYNSTNVLFFALAIEIDENDDVSPSLVFIHSPLPRKFDLRGSDRYCAMNKLVVGSLTQANSKQSCNTHSMPSLPFHQYFGNRF